VITSTTGVVAERIANFYIRKRPVLISYVADVPALIVNFLMTSQMQNLAEIFKRAVVVAATVVDSIILNPLHAVISNMAVVVEEIIANMVMMIRSPKATRHHHENAIEVGLLHHHQHREAAAQKAAAAASDVSSLRSKLTLIASALIASEQLAAARKGAAPLLLNSQKSIKKVGSILVTIRG